MWIIASFGNTPYWSPALNRLKKNFRRLPPNYAGVTHNEKDLENKFKELGLIEFISKNPRGFGYWIWKPILLLKILEDFPKCEGIIYIDAGCELNLNENSIKRLDEYKNSAIKNHILAFQLNVLESDFTAPNVMEKLGIDNQEFSRQCMATTFLISNSAPAIIFLKKWLELMTSDDFKLLRGEDDPLVKKTTVFPEFYVEHRHDQSLFSLLVKSNSAKIIREESEWYPNWLGKGRDFPIWATRNSLRVSINSNKCIYYGYLLIRKLVWLISLKRIYI